jgi:hypothetical protein
MFRSTILNAAFPIYVKNTPAVVNLTCLATKGLKPPRDETDEISGLDPIFPNEFNSLQCLRNNCFGKHIRKRQVSILQKLTLQKTDLLPKPFVVRTPHREASLPMMG